VDLSNRFLYFAYGSNMSLARLRAPGRAPSAERVGAASIARHRLVFDKVGRIDGSGKADCERSGAAGDRVHGGLFRIALEERAALDRAEGAGAGYEAREVEVRTAAGTVRALCYFATRKDPQLRPYGWYIEHVLVGAREFALPPDYIRAIEQIASLPDPDAGRDARERAIHAGAAAGRARRTPNAT
jgi:gamma-glutamylcyclotransferase